MRPPPPPTTNNNLKMNNLKRANVFKCTTVFMNTIRYSRGGGAEISGRTRVYHNQAGPG